MGTFGWEEKKGKEKLKSAPLKKLHLGEGARNAKEREQSLATQKEQKGRLMGGK